MIEYPFVPKSTRLLRAGDYWAVPISGGRFGCGRVIQIEGDQLVTPTRAFFGGLHDWVSTKKPTATEIAGRKIVEFGMMHIKAIVRTGGEILGNRPLDLDQIEAPALLSAHGGPGAKILRGVQTVREARAQEWGRLQVLGYWGYDFIQQLAERHFGSSARAG